MADSYRERSSALLGALVGVAAWTFGYVVTYLVVAGAVRDSALDRVLELLGGEPVTHEIVGWVFFNAHFVDTAVRGLPALGTRTTSFVGADGGFTPLLHLLPAVALIAGGMSLARAAGAESPGAGAMAGVAATVGYLPACVVGLLLFEVSAAGATAGPEAVPAVAIAGVTFPVVLATAGGALAGVGSSARTS